MSLAAGSKPFRPTPPQKGSFPLDHDAECGIIVRDYLQCLKFSQGSNAPGCRTLAKKYLACRMNKYVILWDVVFVSLFLLYLFYVNEISLTSGLMDRDEWKNLGLPEDEVKRNTQSEENIKGSDISKSEGSK